MPFGHVQEGRGTRAAGQVFVGAADGQVHLIGVQVQRHGAGRVAQVPHHERAGLVRRRGQSRDVPQLTGPEVHHRPHEHRDVPSPRPQRRERVADPRDLPAEQAGDGVGQVTVGRKLAGLGQEHRSARTGPGRGHHRVEELNRRGVTGHRLAWGRPDQGANAVTDPFRRRPPAIRVPRPDQVPPPFPGDHGPEAPGYGGRQRAERVPVQVDHPVREHEPLPAGRQRIGGVEGPGGLAGGFHEARRYPVRPAPPRPARLRPARLRPARHRRGAARGGLRGLRQGAARRRGKLTPLV